MFRISVVYLNQEKFRSEAGMIEKTLEWVSKNFVRHGGHCYHFHREGTACLDINDHPDAISFPVYRWNHPLSMTPEGFYTPYCLDEICLANFFGINLRKRGGDE